MTTDSESTFRTYQAALEEDWNYLKTYFKERSYALPVPLTAAKDTVFHLAVFSCSKEPLDILLNIAENDRMTMSAVWNKNEYGDTPLHVAAANGNLEAVKLLVEYDKDLSHDINDEGETPLFKAAAYGRTKVVKYLASESLDQQSIETGTHIIESGGRKIVNYTKLKDIHRQKITGEVKGASILHAAILGENFETALLLLRLDKCLATLEDEKCWTSLNLLATLSSAFKSGYQMGTWISRVFYFCLPIDDSIDDEMESCCNLFNEWWKLGKICSPAREICEAKRKHKLASRLARSLIREDSWLEKVKQKMSSPDVDEPIEENSQPSSLFFATERGIIKIVEEMLTLCPQLVEFKNHQKQNILHVAIQHRQKEIYDLVKTMKIPMTRLVRGIDKNGYTILHHAANMKDDDKETHPAGPVYQLQEELKWYKRVEKMTPSHYRMFPESEFNKNCKELFIIKHSGLLKDAQKWIKETSQSCSAVSVLVATVVFAAAYTVPGGSNEKGYPVFLNNRFFLIFTVMDVVALACSLTSVVTLFKFYKWIKKDLPCKRLKKRLVTKFQCYKNKLSMNDVLSKKNDDQGARPPV
ncbi:uncharacterized protein LOC116120542 isoform X2 [Pistacia vera]|uniref:uncharacterized protein LOC116120542 isoform X2 n=1 Tax=Pistacia vera TaxID=55513 RepID=UPI001263E4F3|nr:uncharacterized protein LOC116120542 isoform X2 [Pistacia vera]